MMNRDLFDDLPTIKLLRRGRGGEGGRSAADYGGENSGAASKFVNMNGCSDDDCNADGCNVASESSVM